MLVIMQSIKSIIFFIHFVSSTFAADQTRIDEQNELLVPDAVTQIKAPALNLRDFLFELFDNGGEDQPFIMHNESKWVMTSADYGALAGYEVEGFPLNWGQLSPEITVEVNDIRYACIDGKWKIIAKYTATGVCRNFRLCDAESLAPFSLPIVLEHMFIPN